MNIAEFLTYIKNDFSRDDKDEQIIQAYNDAISFVSLFYPLGDYKFQSYILLVLLQEDYPLPTNLMSLSHPIRLLEGAESNDGGWPLNHLTKEEYDVKHANPNRATPDDPSTPEDYCVYSRSVLVGPVPDQSIITDGFLLEINWTKKEETQDETTNTTKSLGSEWDPVLKQYAMADLYDGLEMYQEGAVWRAKYQDPYGNPIGILRKLLDRERDIEGRATGSVKNNLL